MKVILNKDLAPLGEEGDVRIVANGYARNYLFPKNIAVPYNNRTIKIFEDRKEQIEERKALKRGDAASIKEKLEALDLEITMPAGPNGRLYGAVTSQTIADELLKLGHQIERRRIDLSAVIKNAGKYKVTVKLYESATAEIGITVIGQEIKTESRASSTPARARRRKDAEAPPEAGSAAEIPEAKMPEGEPETAAPADN